MSKLKYPALGSPKQVKMQRVAYDQMVAARAAKFEELQFLTNAARVAGEEFARADGERDYVESGECWGTFLELYRRYREAHLAYWRGRMGKTVVAGELAKGNLIASRAAG